MRTDPRLSGRRPPAAGNDLLAKLGVLGFGAVRRPLRDRLGSTVLARVEAPRDARWSYLRLLELEGGQAEQVLAEAHRRRSARSDSPLLANGIGRIEESLYLRIEPAPLVDLAYLMHSEVPVDSALEVSLRLAEQLSTPAPADGSLPVHGFIIPELVLLSGMGAVRLIGYEVGEALLAVGFGAGSATLSGQLSPESLRGGPPEPADDVYALGAILAQLLTGQAPHEWDSGLPGHLIDGRRMPRTLRSILERSLAPAGDRFESAARWYEALEGVIFEEHYRASSRSLGFLVEAADAELAAADEVLIPPTDTFAAARVATGQPATGPEAARDLPESERGDQLERLFDSPPGPDDTYRPVRSHSLRSPAGVMAVVAVLVLAAFGLWTFRTRTPQRVLESIEPPSDSLESPPPGEGAEAPRRGNPANSPQGNAAAPDAPAPVGETNTTPIETSDAEADPPSPPARAPAAVGVPPAPAPAAPSKVNLSPPEPAREASGRATPAAATEPPSPARSPSRSPERLSAERPGTPLSPTPEAPTAGPPSSGKGHVNAAEPSRGENSGDASSAPPQLLHAAPLHYPKRARRSNQEAVVQIRVLIDVDGKVLEATVVSEPAGYGLDEAALEAARASKFAPATANGRPVRGWTQVAFSFHLK